MSDRQSLVWMDSAAAQRGRRASVSPAQHPSASPVGHSLLLLPWNPCRWHQCHSGQVIQSSFPLHSLTPSQISPLCVLKEAEVIPKYSVCSCNQRAAQGRGTPHARHLLTKWPTLQLQHEAPQQKQNHLLQKNWTKHFVVWICINQPLCLPQKRY